MLIFRAVTDRLGACPEHDDSWLSDAEHVLGRCDPAAAPALLGVLAAIANDWPLPPVEADRCRRRLGGDAR